MCRDALRTTPTNARADEAGRGVVVDGQSSTLLGADAHVHHNENGPQTRLTPNGAVTQRAYADKLNICPVQRHGAPGTLTFRSRSVENRLEISGSASTLLVNDDSGEPCPAPAPRCAAQRWQ